MRIDKVADQLNLKVALLETLERSSEKDAKTLRLAQKHLAACRSEEHTSELQSQR